MSCCAIDSSIFHHINVPPTHLFHFLQHSSNCSIGIIAPELQCVRPEIDVQGVVSLLVAGFLSYPMDISKLSCCIDIIYIINILLLCYILEILN